MARHVGRSYTPAVFLLFVIPVIRLTRGNTLTDIVSPLSNPNVTAVSVLNLRDSFFHETPSFRSEYLIELYGTGLESNLSLYWSDNGSDCERNNVLKNIWISMSGDRAIYTFPELPDFKINTVYFCLKNGERWTNLGSNFTVNLPSRLQ